MFRPQGDWKPTGDLHASLLERFVHRNDQKSAYRKCETYSELTRMTELLDHDRGVAPNQLQNFIEMAESLAGERLTLWQKHIIAQFWNAVKCWCISPSRTRFEENEVLDAFLEEYIKDSDPNTGEETQNAGTVVHMTISEPTLPTTLGPSYNAFDGDDSR